MSSDKAQLDAYDIKIIKALGERGYLKNIDLADAVGLSASACHQRTARLKKIGVLRGFSADIDISKVTGSVRVLTLLMLEKQDASEFKRVSERIKGTPEIIRSHRITGDFDYVFETLVPDFDAYQSMLEGLFEGIVVKQYQSRIMQETVKISNNAAILSSL